MEINNQHKIKSLLITAGTVEIFVGLLHFAMPYFIYQSNGFMHLTNIESDFVLLVTYAVGILLVAFGVTTILLSTQINVITKLIFYYVLIQIVLWIARIILELLYPLQLNMFYIEPFSAIVLPGLVIELSLFVIAVFFIYRFMQNHSKGGR